MPFVQKDINEVIEEKRKESLEFKTNWDESREERDEALFLQPVKELIV